MNQMAAAAYAQETAHQLVACAGETDQREDEVAAAAGVRWVSPAADAFRHALAASVQELPWVADQLRAAAADLEQDPAAMIAGG
ncbi:MULTISPECIES: hypothetical protein [unclassified Arthrobacter]|uniref:hypothetical protein n=1 Tax=unclassified Arthrobacter TaxID=235627 RepID=UPI001D14D091|nr:MULTISPECIES: hypothetical protein [unclassified Arthrobacter]MCC3278552.1 hypothetical protein [Arthrobacter sp. zg-Y40]MCC9176923.1 hypothetical protein [Arthrobacter sp. zg-Y750]